MAVILEVKISEDGEVRDHVTEVIFTGSTLSGVHIDPYGETSEKSIEFDIPRRVGISHAMQRALNRLLEEIE